MIRLSRIPFQPRRYLHLFKNVVKRKEYFARKLIGFSNQQMYDVVADIRNYEKFVPFCTRSTILSVTDDYTKARLNIGFPPIIEHYTSTVTLVRPHYVKAICRDGRLFTTLETRWKFREGLKSNPQTSIVDFMINFEFKSALYAQVATLFFDKLVEQMEDAFINEAKRRYGKESITSHDLNVVKDD